MADYDRLNGFLVLLCRSLATRRLYFAGHGKVKELAAQLVNELRACLAEDADDDLFIGNVNGNMVYQGLKLTGPTLIGDKFIAFSENLRCGGFSFHRVLTVAEMEHFLDLSAELAAPVASLEEARRLLLAQGIKAISLGNQYVEPADGLGRDKQHIWAGQAGDSAVSSPGQIFQALSEVVRGIFQDAASDQSIDITGTRSVSEYLLEHTRANLADLTLDIQYPEFDVYTVGHSVRVAALAVYVGTALGMEDHMLLQIGTAALLHDVGKAKIPGSIIHKQGKLTEEEFGIMKSHPVLGVEILFAHRQSTNLDRAAAIGHHIRHDGHGYPRLPPWAVRHPVTALLQICDVFEALTATRPYKKAKSPFEAYGIMVGDKGGFDPQVLALFIRAIGLYPPGNSVLLSDGRTAKVVKTGPLIDRPTVLITTDPDGQPPVSGEAEFCDLAAVQNSALTVSQLLGV